MDAIFDKLLSEEGLAGIVILILLTTIVKLYYDLYNSRKELTTSKDVCFKELKEIKEKGDEKYRKAVEQMNRNFEMLDRMLDRLYQFLILQKRG